MEIDLSSADIRRLFEALNAKLAGRSVTGELHIVGGAVMCLVLNARASTKDVDALFVPTKELRDAAAEVAREMQLPEHWLNDAVKAFLSPKDDFLPFLELDHLKVYCASPAYLLAMKALSMRIGAEFHDEADLRYLLRYLNIERYEEALELITQYYPAERLPQKTLYALQEILEG